MNRKIRERWWESSFFFPLSLFFLFCIRSSALRHLGRISSMTWKPQLESRSQQEPAGNRMDCVDKSRPLCHDVLSQQNPAPDKQNQQPRGGEMGIAPVADAADAKIRYKLSFVAKKKRRRKKRRRQDISPKEARGHCGAEDADGPWLSPA